MKRSLRTQLLWGITATTVLVFSSAAVTTFVLIRGSLRTEFDGLLGAKARALATLFEQTDEGLEIEFQDHRLQEFARKVRPEYYQVWDDAGTVLARSRWLGGTDLVRIAGSLHAPQYQAATLPDGRPGRLAGIRFVPPREGERLAEDPAGDDDDDDEVEDDDVIPIAGTQPASVTLVVARETSGLDQTLARLGWLLFCVSSVAVLMTLAILIWLVKSSLRPLGDVAAQIAAIDERGLTSRLVLDNEVAELQPVVLRLNELMQRLEEAFQRERTFTADVAHELRTPLTGLRSTLEVALSRPRGEADYRESLAVCREICHDMQRLVEALLSLARIEAGKDSVDRRYIDLGLLIEKAWLPFADRAARRDLSFDVRGASSIFLFTDADKFRVVLTNLFDNAVVYSDEGGSIDLQWSLVDRGLTLSVSNTGGHLNEEELQRAFDRFWRADAARAATGIHAGLGLALCRKIVGLLGGQISAHSDGEHFTVVLEFGEAYVERGTPSEDAAEISASPPTTRQQTA